MQIIAPRGKKSVQGLTAAERGNTITITICMNAMGRFIPPAFIFPRVNMKQELMDGTPFGSIYSCNKSGWQTKETFMQWFEHFVRCTKPSQEDPVILIFDGHYSHTRNPELIDHARKNHVILICIPPHTSNKMQPLDVAVMFPIKEFYIQEIKRWNAQNFPRVLGTQQICGLFTRAYYRAATPTNAMSGFRATGIYPIDPNIFTPEDFQQNEENWMDVNINHENFEQFDSQELRNENLVGNVNGHQDLENLRKMLPLQNHHDDSDMDESLDVAENLLEIYPSENCEVTSDYHMEDPLVVTNFYLYLIFINVLFLFISLFLFFHYSIIVQKLFKNLTMRMIKLMTLRIMWFCQQSHQMHHIEPQDALVLALASLVILNAPQLSLAAIHRILCSPGKFCLYPSQCQ